MQSISLLDYIILPFVLLIVYGFAYNYRNKHYKKNHPYRKYFIPALTLKISGAIFIGLVYQYYYGGGDTFNYFAHAKIINSAFFDSPVKWFNLLLHIPDNYAMGYYQYINNLYWYDDPASYAVASLTAFIGFFFFTTYLPTAVIFAVISFTGIWALFKTFCSIYPGLVRPIAIATLYIPGVIIWGSGIFKDTICIFGLGWLTYSVFQILVKKNHSLKNIFLCLISFMFVARIKVYILIAFLPALFMWILFTRTQRIKSRLTRVSVKIFSLTMVILGSLFILNKLGEELLGQYSLDKIEATAQITRNWILESSGDSGSGYDLGPMTSFKDMILKMPLAINATLFRPYLWEARKIFVMFSAIESFLFFILTLLVLFKVGLFKAWRTISKDPHIQFCLIFALIFAFAVGVTSGNFGTLSRYKIPALPFYALAILLIYYKNKPLSKPLLRFPKI